jgi:hypothetical protein
MSGATGGCPVRRAEREPSGGEGRRTGEGSRAPAVPRRWLTLALLALAAVAALAVAVLDRGARGPSAEEPVAVVWAVGDGADGSAGAKALAARIAAGRVDRFL